MSLVTTKRLHYTSVKSAVPQQAGTCTSLHMARRWIEMSAVTQLLPPELFLYFQSSKGLPCFCRSCEQQCWDLSLFPIPVLNLSSPVKYCSCPPFFCISSRIVILLIMQWDSALLFHFLSYLPDFSTLQVRILPGINIKIACSIPLQEKKMLAPLKQMRIWRPRAYSRCPYHCHWNSTDKNPSVKGKQSAWYYCESALLYCFVNKYPWC